jgi:F-type H+-transporting ATPase subunit b
MLDFLTINTGDLIFTLINTLILFLIIKHFLFGRVNKILEERSKTVSDTYKNADEANEKAHELEKQYAELMAGAKEKSAQIISDATKKAQRHSDEIVMQAKSEASAIKAKADEDIERQRQRAVNQIRDEISDIAVAVAEKLVEREIDSEDNDRLISEFLESVGERQ